MQTPNNRSGFFDLTPERVLEAVEMAGLECNNLCYPLNSFENRVYEVELKDSSRVVAKFYRPGRWSSEQILEEHAFLEELAAAEIAVCPVRMFPDGTSLKEMDDIFFSVSDRRGGRAPDELDEALATRLGMLTARLHNVGGTRAAPARRPLDGDHFVRRPIAWLEENTSLPPALESRYFGSAEAIADMADRLLPEFDTIRIHADLHLGNVLLRDGVLRLLDFDDMAPGPAVQDMWLALPGRDEVTARLRSSFLAGYEQFRLFDRSSVKLVEPLRGLRLVRYAAWLARRWDDPAFRLGWPQFGTFEYWEGETRDLEDQVKIIQSEVDSADLPEGWGESVGSDQSEELLSNKDYFWDWE